MVFKHKSEFEKFEYQVTEAIGGAVAVGIFLILLGICVGIAVKAFHWVAG